MRAVILKAPGRLVMEEIPIPKCPPEGLLVKMRACAICSTDVKMFHRHHRDLVYPRILGHEVAGVVVESRTPAFKNEDRVQIAPGVSCGECIACRRGKDNMCGNIGIIGFTHDGGFAEFIAVPPQSVRTSAVNPIPDEVSFEEAALAEPLACCLNGQELARVAEGDTVLIFGAGPIGCLHAMLARARGAARVLLAETLERRIAMAAFTKADRIFDPYGEEIEDVVKEETEERGVDIIILACPEITITNPLLDLLATGGRVCLFSGLPPEKAQFHINANQIHYREQLLVGAYGCTAAQNSAALRLVASGRVQAGWLITNRISLDEIQKGLEYTARREGLKAIIKSLKEA